MIDASKGRFVGVWKQAALPKSHIWIDFLLYLSLSLLFRFRINLENLQLVIFQQPYTEYNYITSRQPHVKELW